MVVIRHGLTEFVNWLLMLAPCFRAIPQRVKGPGVLDPDIAAFAADQDKTFDRSFSARPIAEQRAIYLSCPGSEGRPAETLVSVGTEINATLAVLTTVPFLARAGVADLVRTVVTLEDGPCKPDPAPVRLAMQRLGATRAWMVGDTPDDARAASNAGALPLGVVAPGELRDAVEPVLYEAGAALVLDRLSDLEEVL